MSLAEIEAELPRLTVEELRLLALKSWTAFAAKEGQTSGANECDEDDPLLLAALDEAIAQAKTRPNEGSSGEEVRSRIAQWISK